MVHLLKADVWLIRIICPEVSLFIWLNLLQEKKKKKKKKAS